MSLSYWMCTAAGVVILCALLRQPLRLANHITTSCDLSSSRHSSEHTGPSCLLAWVDEGVECTAQQYRRKLPLESSFQLRHHLVLESRRAQNVRYSGIIATCRYRSSCQANNAIISCSTLEGVGSAHLSSVQVSCRSRTGRRSSEARVSYSARRV